MTKALYLELTALKISVIGPKLAFGRPTVVVERSGIGSAGKRTTGDLIADGGGGSTDVGVHEIGQSATKAAHIADGNDGIRENLALDGQVGFVNLRQLKVGIKVHNTQPHGTGRLGGEDMGERRQACGRGSRA